VRLSVPVSTGSSVGMVPGSSWSEQTATGIGDVSLLGEAWILQPRTHERGNVAVGLGVKAPTGSHTVASQLLHREGSDRVPRGSDDSAGRWWVGNPAPGARVPAGLGARARICVRVLHGEPEGADRCGVEAQFRRVLVGP
jgi:hypothetical protein